MGSKNIDDALAGIRLVSELARVRREVQSSEEQNRKPEAYLPWASLGCSLAPNVVLRTALFAAMADLRKKGGVREFVKDRQVEGLSNMRVLFTGQLLDQQDLDVFLVVLNAIHGQPLGGAIAIKARRLLLAQQKGDGGRRYSELEASLKRLAGAVLDVRQGEARFIGSLLSSVRRPRAGDAWTVRVDPELVRLFEPGSYTSLDSKVRAHLQGKPLAKWLDGYYSSQPEANALRIETVKRLSGSQTKDVRSFKQTLVKALNAVADARAANGRKFSWEIDAARLLRVRQ